MRSPTWVSETQPLGTLPAASEGGHKQEAGLQSISNPATLTQNTGFPKRNLPNAYPLPDINVSIFNLSLGNADVCNFTTILFFVCF